MSFADLVKQHLDGIASGPAGSIIGYATWPKSFTAINAVVDDEVLDVEGNLIKGVVDLVISKSAIFRVTLGKDQVRISSRDPDQPGEVFTVHQILGESPGHWQLRCGK